MSTQRCGPLAAWARAWIAGVVSLDQTVDAVSGSDAPHVVAGLPGFEHDDVPLRELLILWRRSGDRVAALLPVPGDVRGVPGPAPFRAAALDARGAVVAGGVGVVAEVTDFSPSSAPSAITWRVHAVDPLPPDHLDVREAQHALTAAIRESAEALLAAEVAGSNANVAELLSGARRAGERLNLPPGFDPAAVALLAQAQRLNAVLDLVSSDPLGGAVDRAGIGARSDALRPLAHTVRRARLAAFNA